MRKTKVDASGLLLVLIALVLAAGLIFAASSMRSDPLEEYLKEDKVINTLFVIEYRDKPLSTYVLMYYPDTKRAAVFDIPGSLGLIIRNINRVDRIDRVYDTARIAPFKNQLETLLGVEIPFSFVITHENLGKITDLIDGVELFIPSLVDENQDSHILFPPGINFLDGEKVKVFVTYELPEESEEFVTSRRQHFFMKFLNRLGEQNQYLSNPDTAKMFHSLLKTTSNQRTQVRLFEEFAGIDTDRVSMQEVSGNIREVSGQQLIFPHWDGNLIKEIVRQTVDGLIRPSEGGPGDGIFAVEVLNGTTISGLAGRTAELFRGFGYDVTTVGNADRSDYEKTIIIDRSGLEDVVLAFADVIRCNNISYDTQALENVEIDQDLNNRADITLIIGRDFNGRYITN